MPGTVDSNDSLNSSLNMIAEPGQDLSFASSAEEPYNAPPAIPYMLPGAFETGVLCRHRRSNSLLLSGGPPDVSFRDPQSEPWVGQQEDHENQ